MVRIVFLNYQHILRENYAHDVLPISLLFVQRVRFSHFPADFFKPIPFNSKIIVFGDSQVNIKCLLMSLVIITKKIFASIRILK